MMIGMMIGARMYLAIHLSDPSFVSFQIVTKLLL
jgi:hypothetical protein